MLVVDLIPSAFLSIYKLVQTGFLVIICLLTATQFAVADWNSGATIEDISTRIAVNVTDDGIQVTVDLAASAINLLESSSTAEHPVTIDSFALAIIKIQAEQELTASIIKPLTLDGETSTSNKIVNVFFPFSEDLQPQQVVIIPAFDLIEIAGDKYMITVSHQGLPVIDHGVITDTETLILDWEDPWYSHFLNPELKRDHHDPVMAFLYLEPRQIKSEIVVRIKEMTSWADLGLRDEVMIYPDEFESVKQKVSQFLLAHNKISAENKTLSPRLERVDYIRMSAADIQAYEPQQAQRQVSTLIGVSLIHQVKTLPVKVRWHWQLFNQKIKRVAIRAYDPAGLFDSYVTPDYPVFEWENMLAELDLPELYGSPKTTPVAVEQDNDASQYYGLSGIIGILLLSLLSYRYISPRFKVFVPIITIIVTLSACYFLFKAGKLSLSPNKAHLDKAKAKPVVKQLLWNIYQAFESTQETDAYDQLADSVNGDLRETLYLQNRQSFLAQDGAWSKVKSIEIKNLTNHSSPLDDGYLFDCEWLVIGEVIHWGHQHRRENLYRANIKISPQNGNWKIFQLESIGQQRVDSKTS